MFYEIFVSARRRRGEMESSMKKSLIWLTIMILIAGCDVSSNGFISNNDEYIEEKTSIKIVADKPYAYTVDVILPKLCETEQNNETFSMICNSEYAKVEVPYINIDNQVIKEINEKIKADMNTENQLNSLINLTEETKHNQTVFVSHSDYYESKNIISVIITSSFYEDTGVIQNKFTAYNIDINTGMLIDNEELLKILNIEEKSVEDSLYNQLEIRNLQICENDKENCYEKDLSISDLVYYVDEEQKLHFYCDKIFESVEFGYPFVGVDLFLEYNS